MRSSRATKPLRRQRGKPTRTLGRGFVRLACGGLRDETDLRGHNRTWKGAQPGSILRELHRAGSKDPVFVLDEIDKVGPAPAAVLLEVLDPAQHHRFRDAFVELPFDLSEALFITTADDIARILPALRDRLEVIDLPTYTEDEKVALAATHLIAARNRDAGLAETPVRFTPAACRRIVRDYTCEPGIRQLARCLQTVCRKVALAHETGDAARVPRCITAPLIPPWLDESAIDPPRRTDRPVPGFRKPAGGVRPDPKRKNSHRRRPAARGGSSRRCSGPRVPASRSGCGPSARQGLDRSVDRR